MKRFISRSLSLGFIIAISFSCDDTKTQKKDNDLKRLELKGNVKSIREIVYKAKESFVRVEKGDINANKYILFNEEGNKIEENSYNSEGSLVYRRIYKYDDKGSKIEEKKYGSEGSLVYRRIYKYDDKGNKMKKKDTVLKMV